MTCVCLYVCVCARRRVGAGMGVVGAGGGSTDTLHGTGYDSGHQPRAHVMLAESRWAGRSEVCFGRDSSMFVRGTCLRAPAQVSWARSSRAHTLAYLSLHDKHTSHTSDTHSVWSTPGSCSPSPPCGMHACACAGHLAHLRLDCRSCTRQTTDSASATRRFTPICAPDFPFLCCAFRPLHWIHNASPHP